MNKADKIIVCPGCGKAAAYYFPFLQVTSRNQEELAAEFPKAELIPYPIAKGIAKIDYYHKPFLRFSQVHHFAFTPCYSAHENAYRLPEDPEQTFILNLFPHTFEWGKNSEKDRGMVSCTHCGYAKSFLFTTNKDLFYKVNLQDRYVYAQTWEELVGIRDFFAGDGRIHAEPDLDFPKLFYQRRTEIVEKIELLLKNT